MKVQSLKIPRNNFRDLALVVASRIKGGYLHRNNMSITVNVTTGDIEVTVTKGKEIAELVSAQYVNQIQDILTNIISENKPSNEEVPLVLSIAYGSILVYNSVHGDSASYYAKWFGTAPTITRVFEELEHE